MSNRTDGIADELLALRDDEGLINAREVVSWARDNTSSLIHHELEWDDAKAAEEHRVWQVRSLIAVHIVDADGNRRFVNLTIDRVSASPGYRDIESVLSREDLRDIMLRDALAELERVQRKYAKLRELASVWAAAHVVARKKRSATRKRPQAEDRAPL